MVVLIYNSTNNRAPFSLQLPQHLLFDLFIVATLSEVVLICIYPVASGTDDYIMHLLTTCIFIIQEVHIFILLGGYLTWIFYFRGLILRGQHFRYQFSEKQLASFPPFCSLPLHCVVSFAVKPLNSIQSPLLIPAVISCAIGFCSESTPDPWFLRHHDLRVAWLFTNSFDTGFWSIEFPFILLCQTLFLFHTSGAAFLQGMVWSLPPLFLPLGDYVIIDQLKYVLYHCDRKLTNSSSKYLSNRTPSQLVYI